jgi:hypothetical protein
MTLSAVRALTYGRKLVTQLHKRHQGISPGRDAQRACLRWSAANPAGKEVAVMESMSSRISLRDDCALSAHARGRNKKRARMAIAGARNQPVELDEFVGFQEPEPREPERD